jgi:hypothetical protein
VGDHGGHDAASRQWADARKQAEGAKSITSPFRGAAEASSSAVPVRGAPRRLDLRV